MAAVERSDDDDDGMEVEFVGAKSSTSSYQQGQQSNKKYWLLIGIGVLFILVAIGVGVGGGISARNKRKDSDREASNSQVSSSSNTSPTETKEDDIDNPITSRTAWWTPHRHSPTSPAPTIRATTTSPSVAPTPSPTNLPTFNATPSPTDLPTIVTTPSPTTVPTVAPTTDMPSVAPTDNPTIACPPEDPATTSTSTSIQATYAMRWLANYGVYPYYVPCSKQAKLTVIATCLGVGGDCDTTTTISYVRSTTDEGNVVCTNVSKKQMKCESTSFEEGSAFYDGPKVTFTCTGPTDESTRVTVEIPQTEYVCPNVFKDVTIGEARGGSQEHQLSLWRVCSGKNNEEQPREYTCMGEGVEYHYINGQCIADDGCITPSYNSKCSATVPAVKLQSTSVGFSERECLLCDGSVCPDIKQVEGGECASHNDCMTGSKCVRSHVNTFGDFTCCKNHYLYLYDFQIKYAYVCKNQPPGTDCVFITDYNIEVPFHQMCSSFVCNTDDGKCT